MMKQKQMTTKEVEHFLIDNGFSYQADKSFWTRKGTWLGVTGDYVVNKPGEAYQFILDQINSLGLEIQ